MNFFLCVSLVDSLCSAPLSLRSGAWLTHRRSRWAARLSRLTHQLDPFLIQAAVNAGNHGGVYGVVFDALARAGGVALWVFLFLLGQHVLHVGVVQHVGQQGFAVGLKPSAHAQVGNHSPQLAG